MSKVSQKASKMSKKFCKVCFDAGKEEKEYTSHFVRSSPSKNSVVVCPLLLSLHCNYCKEKGHTIKYCKVLLVKQKQHKKGKPLENMDIFDKFEKYSFERNKEKQAEYLYKIKKHLDRKYEKKNWEKNLKNN